MKTKKLFLALLAFSLSVFTSTAFGQVSVTANSFSYSNNLCFNSQFVKVMELVIENQSTNPADSIYTQDLGCSEYSSPFTLPDSLTLFLNGKKLSINRFVSNQSNVSINKWIPASSSITIEVYCKTLSVSQRTDMIIYANTLSYIIGSSSQSIWFNRSSPWFYTYDCTMPIISHSESITLSNPTCYDIIGDTLTTTSIKIKNPNKDTMVLNGLSLKTDNNYWQQAKVDSVFVLNSKNEKLAAGVFSSTSFNQRVRLKFNIKIPGSKSVEIRFAYKFSSLGITTYTVIDSVYWVLNKKDGKTDVWYYLENQVSLFDCKPNVELEYFESKRSDKLCTGDNIGIYPRINNTFYPVLKHEYFVNGKLYRQYNNEINYDYVSVPLTYPKTRIMVKITDTSGRFAIDSTTLNVEKTPIPKMYASNTSMCHGEYITLSCDTNGLAKWAWDWETPSNTVKTKNIVFIGGYHNFFATAKNGCVADTSVNIYEIPAQDKPTVVINDWVLGSSVKADSFLWSKYNDTSKKWVNISNSNKMFVSRTDKGFYMVKAWNSGGCFAESDMVYHNGYTVKDSLPHLKLLFTASKPGTSFCSNEKIIATRKILETIYPIVKEEWYLNGNKISFTSNQLFDGMEYFVPMNTGTVKIKVVITDKVGKTAVDSFILTINKSPKAIISTSGSKMCAGNGIIITADTTGLSKWAWGNDKPSQYTNKLTVYEGGSYMFTAIASNGCSADTTVMLTKIPAQAKPTGLSNDWTIGSSVNATSFVWYRLNDTTNKLQAISNSNKMFMKETRKGYYAVEAFNSYGCSQISDNFLHNGWILKDSMPYVKLISLSSNPGLKFCPDERVMVTRKILEPVFPIVSEQWFWNGKKIPFTKNQMFDGMEYRVPLTASVVILKVVVIDKAGKTAKDSIVITVNKSPKALVKLSSNTFCSGNNVTLTADTTGIAKYAWNNDKLSVYPTKLSIDQSGSYKFTVSSKEGCLADTTVMVTKLQTPNKPTGLSNDWTIGSNESADSFVFHRLNDTTNKFEIIKNSNKMFVRELRKGYYYVELFNKNGCSSSSPTFFHKGWVIQDSLPHVKLRITASKPGTKFCSSEKVIAGRQVLETAYPVVSENWYLNGNKIPFTKNQIFDAMEYSIPMVAGNVKLKVVVTDKIGKVASDSFECTVFPKPKITLSHFNNRACYGQDVTIWLDTIGINTWQYNGIPSKNWKNIITVFESSTQSITASTKEGCTADTSFAITMLPAQERLVISSYDTMLWTNQNAFDVEWFYNSNSFSVGKQIILTNQSGLYQVRASNSYGCTSISNLFLFTYVGPQDPITPKDSSQIKISTNDKVVNSSICPGDFHPKLDMNYMNQNAVKKAEWFFNGKSIYVYTATCLCAMYPISINLTSGKAIIIVLVSLSNSTVKSDTINLTVQSVAKPMLEYSKGPYCADKEINFSIKPGSYSNVEWPNGKTGNSFSVTGPNDLYFAKVVDVNGCTIYSDSIEIHSVVIPKPTMALSKGNLYASIDFDRSGGLWHWYAGDTLKESTQLAKYTPRCEEFWRVKFMSQNGCISPFSNAEFVEYTSAGIRNINQTGITVYPNPFQDQLTVDTEAGSEVVFIDLNGRVIYTVKLQSKTEQINTSHLPAGFYVVSITKDDKINHFKLLKQ